MKRLFVILLFAASVSSPCRAEPPARLPYAEPLPGHPGYVRSPYQPDGVIDVRGLARGAQAHDPYTNKAFLVPVTTQTPPPRRPLFAKVWDPDTAVGHARRDIAAERLRFCYVGGFAPRAPGLPPGSQARLKGYARLAVGPQGCVQDSYAETRAEYAARYNATMWAYVSHQP